jgi:Flp pilus assembly secretin CpaC
MKSKPEITKNSLAFTMLLCTIKKVGADRSEIMKKTKRLAATLLAGFVLQQSIHAQPNVDATNQLAVGTNQSSGLTISNEVYAAMVSNVSKMDTSGDETITATSSMTTTSTTISNKSSSVTVISSTPSNPVGSNSPSPTIAGSNETSSIVGSNEPSGMTASNETTGTDTNNPPTALDTNGQPVEETDTNTPAAVLPIQFQDVPITTAIESLARLAGINYLLDPKIGYGQPDQNGQIKAEPTLSIRWENVTAEQALRALLDNYGLQLVEDSRTKIAKITTKDPSAPPPLVPRVIQLKYSSTATMEAAVKSTLTDSRSKVVADERTSQLVVVATDKEQEDVDALINLLDKITRQVLIETKLVEISSNPTTTKGIDWSGTLQAQNFSFGNGQLSGTTSYQTPGVPVTTTGGFGGGTTTTTPKSTQSTALTVNEGEGGLSFSTASGFLPGTGFLNANGVNAVFSFLNASSDAQVISTPRVVTLDNTTAHIEVTRAFPVINITAGTQNNAGGSSITYSNLGTVLDVTPRISANDYIWLKVTPQVSSFFATENKIIDGAVYQADEFDSRMIDSQVLIPNGNTLVMGGLVKDNPSSSYTKVPVLGDIPILGFAFRNEIKSLDKDNLLIFITPTIVKDTDFAPAPTQFLKSRPTALKPSMNPRSFWDSAKPLHDWSNPLPPADDINAPQNQSNPSH